MLANDLIKTKPDAVRITARTRAELDIRNGDAIEAALDESRPDWVFNCAAYTNVDAAETDPGSAFAVNAEAVDRIARLCALRNTRLLHFSTDFVFDGAKDGFYGENDQPGPVNVYGESKLAGEVALLRSGAGHLLIRTQWLFGVHGRSFVGAMYDRARAGQKTRVVADEMGCCTYTVDLAKTVWELLGRGKGTVHVANRGRISRHTLATRIFDHFGAGSLVSACSTAEFGSTTRRPANSALSVSFVEELLGREMPSWEDALARYLAERDDL